MTTHYDLRVGQSTKTTSGSRLTQLSAVAPGGPTLNLITTIARNTNTGVGDAAFGAATVYLRQSTINTIHDRVHDNNPNRHVTVQFTVSSTGTLSGFEHSYSS